VSYAEIASKGPKQSPEEVSLPWRFLAPYHDPQSRSGVTDNPQAAAPQPPQVVTSTTASTASLIDVDTPSVRTVPSNFDEQEVQTETQAARIEREKEADAMVAKARAEADLAKKKARHKARKADNWLTKRFESMSDDESSALAVANILAVVGLSGWLGYRAWGLYDNERLSWKHVGLGMGIVTAVGVFETAMNR